MKREDDCCVSRSSWGIDNFRIRRFWLGKLIFSTQLNLLCPFSHLSSLEKMKVFYPSFETLTAGPGCTCPPPPPPTHPGPCPPVHRLQGEGPSTRPALPSPGLGTPAPWSKLSLGPEHCHPLTAHPARWTSRPLPPSSPPSSSGPAGSFSLAADFPHG